MYKPESVQKMRRVEFSGYLDTNVLKKHLLEQSTKVWKRDKKNQDYPIQHCQNWLGYLEEIKKYGETYYDSDSNEESSVKADVKNLVNQ